MGSLIPISVFLLIIAFSTSLQISSSRKVEPKTKEANVEHIRLPIPETSSVAFDPSQVIQLSWHPRAFLYTAFLSDDECDHLISQARGKLENTTSRGNNTLSAEVFLSRGQDEVIAKIEERIAAWTFLPKENGENIEVSLYNVNEGHAPFYDNNFGETKPSNGGNRIATVLMHLSTVVLGGETVFPKSELKGNPTEDNTPSDCAANGYAIKPVKGDALLFFSLHPDATKDESSLHGSCNVLEGEKWTATKWIHVKAFNALRPVIPETSDSEECMDQDDNCSQWAATGECSRNPVFMLGSPDYYGTCRKSCGAC